MYGVVYRIMNLETGKCYIGRTKRPLYERWYQHCNRSSNCVLLKRAIVKYGKENFSIHAIASSWNSESLKELEILLIQQENTLSPTGYNLINNGYGVSEVSDLTREKLSKASKGRIHTEETRRKMSEGSKGKPKSEEHCLSMSRTRLGRPSKMKGKKFSEEARKNMGGQNKGTKASAETIQKRSQSLKGIKWYTDGVSDIRIHEGDPIPDNFRPGRTKGLNNLSTLIDNWNDPLYRKHMSEVHKKASR